MKLDHLRTLCDLAEPRKLDELICGYSCNTNRSFTPQQLDTLVSLLAERFGPMADAIEKLVAVAEGFAELRQALYNHAMQLAPSHQAPWAKTMAALAALEAAP